MKPRLLLFLLVMAMFLGNVRDIKAATFEFQATYVNRIFSGSWENLTENNTFFSTYHYVNPQRSLVLTPIADFLTALEVNLGALGSDEYYEINSAALVVGDAADDYATTGTAGAYEVLRSYDPHSVSWNNFGNGGTPGVEYAAAAAATGQVGFFSTSWTLTDLVIDWISGASDNFGLFFPDYADTGSGALEEYTRANNVVWVIDAEKAAIPTHVIPEPATMILFGLGLLGLSGVGRRRR